MRRKNNQRFKEINELVDLMGSQPLNAQKVQTRIKDLGLEHSEDPIDQIINIFEEVEKLENEKREIKDGPDL